MKYILSFVFILLTGCLFSNKASNTVENPGCHPPLIVIYTTSWCHSCKDAADYVRANNYCLIEKNVDEFDDAKREVKKVLANKGMEYGSFPVIDVDGDLRIGFSEKDLQSAIDRYKVRVKSGKTL
jgi:glutaredoxin